MRPPGSIQMRTAWDAGEGDAQQPELRMRTGHGGRTTPVCVSTGSRTHCRNFRYNYEAAVSNIGREDRNM
jgi:hypothetical protein